MNAPDFVEGKPYPSKGEKIGPSWVAMWGFLKNHIGEWHAGTEIVLRLSDAILCDRRTALNLLAGAANAGILEAVQRPGGTPKRHRVEYRISDAFKDWESANAED